MQGFIVSDWRSQFPQGIAALIKLYQDGKLQTKETVVKGFESAPSALVGLFKGDNIGKMMVDLRE